MVGMVNSKDLYHHPTMDVIRYLLEANESVYCRKVADLKLFISLANNQNLLNGVTSRSESILVISY